MSRFSGFAAASTSVLGHISMKVGVVEHLGCSPEEVLTSIAFAEYGLGNMITHSEACQRAVQPVS